jgi:hypothetical protein
MTVEFLFEAYPKNVTRFASSRKNGNKLQSAGPLPPEGHPEGEEGGKHPQSGARNCFQAEVFPEPTTDK